MIPTLIVDRERIDEKCMTLLIGKVEEKKEEVQMSGDSKKSVEAVGPTYPNGQVYV